MTKFAASVHFRLSTESRPSTIPEAGLGAFALEKVPAGTFLGMDFLTRKWVVSPEEVLALPPESRKYAWRHIDNICISAVSGEQSPADFINHSFEPNILWHLGHYFSLKDIEAGDELFIDYRHLHDPSWGAHLHDASSGRSVPGWSWRESLLHSSRQLATLLEKSTGDA